MPFQKILWRWNQRWSWPCLPAWWAEEWSEYKRVDPYKGKKKAKCNKNPTCHPGCMSSRSALTTLKCCWPKNCWSSKDFVLLCKTTLIKILRERSFNQQMCSFPKGKFNLSRAHRNAFITVLHLAILLWSCFHSIISQILGAWFFYPWGL